MRDMQKVVQGILSVPANKFEASDDNRLKLLKLLLHESLCVYGDKLVNNEDKKVFLDILIEKVELEYNIKLEEITEDLDNLYFGNFMEMHSVLKSYEEIEELPKLI
mmetsp:Transcript_11421/g.9818  ORF Transcript_11421/g.9818 Transcript_11421/m.9818 type:complete len:106 (-) Transcript_11421:3705-4022(-)|eukprot:CAMPEP_0114575544 /NCGR_PEP_ID=MMETSP0125-20121206/399_1 /TAXON_ID=485358 ORGANISM="Aristerostoma sp., Strain ATCC 50986" /NCGR_SAMPLE_ID=MMETSP0125 /ASSEMBLY_ACC=CAM_ASM_000245 /LENGTH=105 /DNA_ID=CAMNT_0001763351 /DNA_START=109 /DNA_END=426 /DNA_ORIENTATION=-